MATQGSSVHVTHGVFIKSSWLDTSEKSLHAG